MSRILEPFKRITSSNAWLPEVDGLRFLAIFSVVVIMHITGYLNDKFYKGSFIEEEYWKNIVIGGGGGVALFFMISGFILSWPFAKWRLANGRTVSLKRYYLRRFTRLEPPYIIALVILFAAQVWLLDKYEFSSLLPHLMASIFYLHTYIYDSFSWILPVAWSLEVEVQFYLLAPLIFSIFRIRESWLRWAISLMVIFSAAVYWHDTWTKPHLFKFIHYFFCGILLSDLYTNQIRLIRNDKTGLVLGMLTIAGFVFIPSLTSLSFFLFRLFCMFMLFHLVLTNPYIRSIFSKPLLVVIGGMCYSIYLLHFAVVSATGTLLMQTSLQVSGFTGFFLLACLMAILVLLISAVYFLLIEKPFMKPFADKTKKLIN